MIPRYQECIPFLVKKKWAHRKTVLSKSCCVIFIYRSIHSPVFRSPCPRRWSWGTTIASIIPVAPRLVHWRTIARTLSLVGLLRSLSLFLSSLFHLIRNIGTPFPPYHMGRMQVNKNGVVRISVCRCNHEDAVITGEASFIGPEGKLTSKSMWSWSSNLLISSSYSSRACPHSTIDSIQQSPRSSVFFASSAVYVAVAIPSRCVARKSRSRK